VVFLILEIEKNLRGDVHAHFGETDVWPNADENVSGARNASASFTLPKALARHNKHIATLNGIFFWG
jgi:hypothetical protein